MFYKKGSTQNQQNEIELQELKHPIHDELLLSLTSPQAIISLILLNTVNVVPPSDKMKELLKTVSATQELMLKKLYTFNSHTLNKNPEQRKILEEHWIQNEKPYLIQQKVNQFMCGKAC
jgi:hypothetical protein